MVQEHKEQNWLITVSLVIVAVVATAVALIYTRAIMVPFVVSLFIVALVAPIEDFQVKRMRLPRVIAVAITLLIVISIIALVFLLITQATATIVLTAWDYSLRIESMVFRILQPLEQLLAFFYEREEPPHIPAPNDTGPLPSQLPEPVAPPPALPREPGPFVLYPKVEGDTGVAVLDVRSDPVVREFDEIRDPNDMAIIDPLPTREMRIDTQRIVRDLRNYIFGIVTNAFGIGLGLVSGVFFVSIFIIFLLAGRNPYADHSQVYKDIVQKIRRYVGTKVIVSAVTGVLVWVSLTLIGLPLAGVFGVLAFMLNFIPSIGSIISTLLPIPIALAEFHQDPLRIVMVAAIPGVIQGVLGNIVEPKLMGEGLNLHPVAILLALSFWGLLWGIVGMLLAAPITAAIRIVLMQFDTLRPIANLLAGELTTQPSAPPPEAVSGDSLLE